MWSGSLTGATVTAVIVTIGSGGATIRGNGTFVSPIPGNPNGSTTVGAGIAVSQHTTNKNITVTVDQDTKIYAQKQITMARPQGVMPLPPRSFPARSISASSTLLQTASA